MNPTQTLEEIRERCVENAGEPARNPTYWAPRFAEFDAGQRTRSRNRA